MATATAASSSGLLDLELAKYYTVRQLQLQLEAEGGIFFVLLRSFR